MAVYKKEMDEFNNGKTPRCIFCSNDISEGGIWSPPHNDSLIGVCSECAISGRLGELLGDSISQAISTTKNLSEQEKMMDKVLEENIGKIWRAIARYYFLKFEKTEKILKNKNILIEDLLEDFQIPFDILEKEIKDALNND